MALVALDGYADSGCGVTENPQQAPALFGQHLDVYVLARNPQSLQGGPDGFFDSSAGLFDRLHQSASTPPHLRGERRLYVTLSSCAAEFLARAGRSPPEAGRRSALRVPRERRRQAREPAESA